MKPESLIFDIDGTLWDSRSLVARGYNQYLREIHREDLLVDEAYLTGLFGKTTTQIADEMLMSIPKPERYQVIAGCMAREHQVMQDDPCAIAYPGVVDTLKQLGETYRLFVVSNSQKGYPRLMMEKLGLEDLFEGCLCFGDTLLPKGDTIRQLMAHHTIRSGVYIGDTQGDLEASRQAGVPFVFCRYGFGQPKEYDWVIDAFPELLTLWK